MRHFKLLTCILVLCFIFSCSENEGKNSEEIKTKIMINRDQLKNLQGKRVFFGHQSVGNNIISGLDSLIIRNSELSFIKIVDYDKFMDLNVTDDTTFYLIHAPVGKNGNPGSKLQDFEIKLESIQHINAAFLKFCFVDVTEETDVKLLYNNYIESISLLQSKYKNIDFAYFTIPLITKRNIFIRVLKKIYTLVTRNPDNSIKRNEFNSLLRNTNNIKLFDIAYLESSADDNSVKKNNEFLLKRYASDPGHLNEIGSEKVANHLLVFLSNILSEYKTP